MNPTTIESSPKSNENERNLPSQTETEEKLQTQPKDCGTRKSLQKGNRKRSHSLIGPPTRVNRPQNSIRFIKKMKYSEIYPVLKRLKLETGEKDPEDKQTFRKPFQHAPDLTDILLNSPNKRINNRLELHRGIYEEVLMGTLSKSMYKLLESESTVVNGMVAALQRKISRLRTDPDFVYRLNHLQQTSHYHDTDLKGYTMDLFSLPSQRRDDPLDNRDGKLSEITLTSRAFESLHFSIMDIADLSEILGKRMGHLGPLKVEQILNFIHLAEQRMDVIPNRRKIYQHLKNSLMKIDPSEFSSEKAEIMHENCCLKETKRLLEFSSYPRVQNIINPRLNYKLPMGKGGEVIIPFQIEQICFNRTGDKNTDSDSFLNDPRIEQYRRVLEGIPFTNPNPITNSAFFERNGIGILHIKNILTQAKLLLAVKDYVTDLQRKTKFV